MRANSKVEMFMLSFIGVLGTLVGTVPIANSAQPQVWDQAIELVDQLNYKTLDAMETDHLTSSQLDVQPWSGSYWPFFRGMIAWRYSDPNFPQSSDWREISNYLLASSNANFCSTDLLSPAEKYDLLVGDRQGTLKLRVIEEGRPYFEAYGSVERWMGICNGWASASYSSPRPSHAVDVLARDGRTMIRFFPSDIKALESLLFAKGTYQTRFIGKRCKNQTPSRDAHGRITDPNCYGENAGTWHLSVVNQIGASRRSFVMNANHNTQVWNQPIYSYSYTYFNPQTNEPKNSLSEAQINIEDFTNDKFKAYRAKNAHSVVGISMEVTYISETFPSHSLQDSPENDTLKNVRYIYDLELGSNQEILGGEWYSSLYPGFLWTPIRNARAFSVGDTLLARSGHHMEWDGSRIVPKEWDQAIKASSSSGQPLAAIVHVLNVMSNL